MTRLKRLYLRQIFWLSPFIIIFLPWILFEWAAEHVAELCAKVGDVSSWLAERFPPKWWPSERIKLEIFKEQHRLKAERIARMQSRVQKADHAAE